MYIKPVAAGSCKKMAFLNLNSLICYYNSGVQAKLTVDLCYLQTNLTNPDNYN
jgi:hypothetical protein